MTFSEVCKKVFTKKAYAVRTFASDPLMSFKFKVSISGISSTIGFKSVSGLTREIEVVEYLENAYDYAHKLPGRETVGEITFERGMYADKAFETAYTKLFTGKQSRRDVTINVCDRFGKVRRTFKLGNCWFSSFEVGNLDASSSEVLIETLKMQFETFL